MKKYLLPLILMMLLAFTLIGDCWVAGYDQRIKVTTDHTKVDATLSNFPVTAFFTAAQGEEIFAEFDADSDFDRGQFALGDDTLLYADCEKFDDSASIGIYHFKVTSVSSSAGTDIYFYYDNDHAHNTTYISKSGGTAAQSVYDGNFKAVYHMHDFNNWTTQYEATVEPDSDGWTLGGTDYASVSAGILTIDTSASDNYQCYYYQTPDVNFDNGFYLKTRVKASTDMAGGDFMEYIIHDGTQNERVIFRIEDGNLRWIYNDNQNGSAVLDTTTAYVVYEIYVIGNNCKIYADSVLKANFTVDSETVSDVVEFGDTSATWMVKAEIDYVYYALDIGWNPLLDTAIIDSTSNANDGMKKSIGEPVEATGKVGQGQNFDGTDDYITLGNNTFNTLVDNSWTIEAVFNPDTLASGAGNYERIIDLEGRIAYLQSDVDTSAWKLGFYNGSALQEVTNNTGYATGSYVHLAGVWDKTDDDIHLYINGGNIQTANCTGTPDNSQDRANVVGCAYDVATRFSDGIKDEVRLSSTERNAAWIKATYNSLWDALLTYGSEETSIVINVINFGCNF